MCCSRRPREEDIIRGQSKKPTNSCWGKSTNPCWGKPEEDGWIQGNDNIGFKNKNNKTSTINVNSTRRGRIHPQ